MIRHLWNKISEIKANSAFGLRVAFKLGIISRFKKSHTYNQEVILNYLEDFFKDIAIDQIRLFLWNKLSRRIPDIKY